MNYEDLFKQLLELFDEEELIRLAWRAKRKEFPHLKDLLKTELKHREKQAK